MLNCKKNPITTDKRLRSLRSLANPFIILPPSISLNNARNGTSINAMLHSTSRKGTRAPIPSSLNFQNVRANRFKK